MDAILNAKPPWKTVEWIRSQPWTTEPSETMGPWIQPPDNGTATVKEHIGTLDKQHKWELAKKMVNPFELVYTHDDTRLPPSLTMEQPLSRSFFKMIELLDILQFFKRTEATKLRTAHVAEGPGGFIQALYHVAEAKQRSVASSFAITLKPTSPHVPGWKKATALLHKYKQIRIHYGADGTGDIYKEDNQTSFLGVAGAGTAHLFTADGGFDFSVDYTQQEQKVYPLLLASARIGLQVLKPGGAFVLKVFDCSAAPTTSLILLLGRCFQEWTLYKPAMTRPCNSERYFLGRGFRGSPPWMSALLGRWFESASLGAPQFPTLQEPLSPAETTFLQTHMLASSKQQIASIEQAIHLSAHPEEWMEQWFSHCLRLSYLWCETFRINAWPLSNYRQLMNQRAAASHTARIDASRR
jgi:23S rRNA U2552 (ribose-2'-O)-methylase RlmE/FtsJ